jgi:Tfp pilus assembly protein PilO
MFKGKFMKGVKNNGSISYSLVLAGIWLINILIVLFGFPFLIYKKIQEIYVKATKNSRQKIKTKSKAARYFPCRG